MKIRKIKFNNHKVLNNLALDFVDPITNEPFDTVIIAGENGCGKTAILEEIYSTIGEFDLTKNNGEIELEIQIDIENLKEIKEKIDAHEMSIPTNIVNFRYSNESNGSWLNLKITFFNQERHLINRQSSDYFANDRNNRKRPFRAFFSEAAISFKAPSITAVGVSTVDDSVPARRGGADLAQSITQLLVDIRAADNEDAAVWHEKNPGVALDPAMWGKRMKRFREAIDFMFPKKRFKTVSRSQGSHRIEFEENGKITSLDELSTGEKQIVFRGGFLLRDLASIQGGVFLLDEPELSLHPTWQARILGFYQRLLTKTPTSTTQLIVATHSPFVVHDQPSAKIIILKKNEQSGIIEIDPDPIYPTTNQVRVNQTLNVESLLERSEYRLILFVEGDTDKIILETAWEKLYPHARRYFEVRPTYSHKAIRTILNEGKIFEKNPSKQLIGLYDFDSAYIEWKGTWNKNSSILETDASKGILKKRENSNGWSMLLPVPTFRSHLASEALAGNSALSIELLFKDHDHLPGMIAHDPLPAAGAFKPRVLDSKKVEFSEHIKTLEASSFEAFKPIFDRLKNVHGDSL
ncbi:AAA family ATPase [Burkholderia gladioli]|uniref:AAA family ATPase n=1 Tax=Burkholderia gladioli TaxID=28095 RepID=UPI0015E7B5FF|nr:AAA family ATPase [Burkholderia gladioli]MBA1363912.1 AAA family ATPase [Burkholderia gladioli]